MPDLLPQAIQQQEQSLKQQQELMTSIVKEMQLPKREIVTFDGNPLDFYLIIRYFKASVASKTEDDSSRLSHLISHCRGEALRAIKHCAAIPEGSGYDIAWKILKKFRQPHRVSEALLKSIIDGPAINTWDSSSLSALATDMRSAELTLTSMKCESDMNSSNTIDKIILRLPTHIQQKWVSTSTKIYDEGRFPDFHDLTDFVEERAEAVNSRFGQLVGKRPGSDPKTKKTTTVKSKVTTLVTSQFPTRAAPHAMPCQCPLCGANHMLSTCESFGKLGPVKMKAFVRERKLCDLCFLGTHFSRSCPAQVTCGLSTDTGLYPKQHHQLLHGAFVKPINTAPTREAISSATQDGETVTVNCGATGASHDIMLGFLPVKIVGNGIEVETYAFIDNGSDTTLVDRQLIERLSISGTKVNDFTLTTVHGSESQGLSERVAFQVKPFKGNHTIAVNNAWTVNGLPIFAGSIPNQKDLRRWPHLRNINIPMLRDSKISLLIGCDVPEAHWVVEQRVAEVQSHTPCEHIWAGL